MTREAKYIRVVFNLKGCRGRAPSLLFAGKGVGLFPSDCVSGRALQVLARLRTGCGIYAAITHCHARAISDLQARRYPGKYC